MYRHFIKNDVFITPILERKEKHAQRETHIQTPNFYRYFDDF
jgi:hypothetical protein